jgi:hypothetical protein
VFTLAPNKLLRGDKGKLRKSGYTQSIIGKKLECLSHEKIILKARAFVSKKGVF